MSGAPVRLRLPRSRKPNATRKIIDKPLSKYPYPIPSREEILGVLRTSDAPLAANDIAEALSIKRQEREGFSGASPRWSATARSVSTSAVIIS
ncbi:hypothetical protein TKS_16250 [Burkholderia pseudomallei]|nr:hypothetical protein TKS_16250 [Burkholderia pseudomallei]